MAQWLDRYKFGSGKNGSPAVSGVINTYATCTGILGASSLTTALAASPGDMIFIHQSQGTGVGQWEVNYVLADVGATLTLAYPLTFDYVSGAQVVLMPQYVAGTLSGAVTATPWNGSVGGITALVCNGNLVITGSITADFAGYRGATSNGAGVKGKTGEGENGGRDTTQTSANGIGGGGGDYTFGNQRKGGGGGGYGSGGGTGGIIAGGGAGIGAGTIGNGPLTLLFFGGGGGSGSGESGTSGGTAGGAGGGIVIIFAKSIDCSGATQISCQGVAGGTDLNTGAGGGGAGGSILMKCQSAVLGTLKITSYGGSGGDGNTSADGGGGGNGRIHIDYFSGFTGTSDPTIDFSQDANLMSAIYGTMV